jgi:ribonuclease HII
MKKTKQKVNLYEFDKKYYELGYQTIGGIDEVGRGCWAGPLVGGIVIFPKSYINLEINDSKKLSKQTRERLYEEIKHHALVADTIFIPSAQVDIENNIKTSTKTAMMALAAKYKDKAGAFLVDGEKLNGDNIKYDTHIKGDAKSMCIAAASIIAKVERDYYMEQVALDYPLYGFDKHKGYGTELHKNALIKHGAIEGLHRFSYQPIKNLAKKK